MFAPHSADGQSDACASELSVNGLRLGRTGRFPGLPALPRIGHGRQEAGPIIRIAVLNPKLAVMVASLLAMPASGIKDFLDKGPWLHRSRNPAGNGNGSVIRLIQTTGVDRAD